MNGKIAADAAIGKPTSFQLPVLFLHTAEIDRVQWNGAQEQRKTQTHPNSYHDGHVPWFGQGKVTGFQKPGFPRGSVRVARRSRMIFEPGHNLLRKQLLEFLYPKEKLMSLLHNAVVAEWQSIGTTVREAGGHHFQVDVTLRRRVVRSP